MSAVPMRRQLAAARTQILSAPRRLADGTIRIRPSEIINLLDAFEVAWALWGDGATKEDGAPEILMDLIKVADGRFPRQAGTACRLTMLLERIEALSGRARPVLARVEAVL